MAAEPSSGRLAAHLDTLLVVRSPAGDDGAAQEFRGSAYVLAHYSPYLRAALAKEWAQGDSKQVELTEHPQAFGHLLDFMHSMGNPDRLPSEAEALMLLLPTAHKLGVEACVAAAAARLLAQADQLCWDKTVQALALVDGMECEDADASSQLDLLRQAAVGRLVQLLGSLDDMLNDEDRRQRFCLLPIVALEALYASDDLTVNFEETAFCAFAHG